MKVSKVVLIVVALHVLVIGGIFVFEGCSRANKMQTAENSDDMTSPDALAKTDEGTPAPVAATETNSPASTLTPADQQAAATATTIATPIPAAVVQTPPPATRTYTVKKGDSLMKIAKAEKVSVAELARVNAINVKTAMLHIGQKLTIPAPAVSAPVATATASVVPLTSGSAAPVSTDVSGANYAVKAGDSLWKIARQQNTSVSAITKANNLTSDKLKVGQKLLIPAASATAATTGPVNAAIATSSHDSWREPGTYTEGDQTIHVVNMGESPSTIAKQYHIKTDALMKANNITDAKKVQFGQRLVIPIAQPTTVAAAAIPVAATPAPSAPVTEAPTATPAMRAAAPAPAE